MMRALSIAVLALAVAACGQTAQLKPKPGRSMPVKPLLASKTPSVDDLLELAPKAKPKRIDELLTRSQPRKADRFDLPPTDGEAAPSETGDTVSAPATTGPDNVEEPR